MSKNITPLAVLEMRKKAKSNPYLVNSLRIDATGNKRKETLPDVPIQQVLALYKMCESKPHELQRNTEARLANPAKTGHLRNAETVPTTQQNASFVYFEEKLEVLDANHRMNIWANPGEVAKMPACADVTYHYPRNLAEYNLLYRSIDSSLANKTNQDNLYGILHSIGVPLASPLFKSVKVVTTVVVAACLPAKFSPDDFLAGAQSLAEELAILDSYLFESKPRKTYSSGVWVGLLTLLKDGAANRERLRSFAGFINMARAMPDQQAVEVPTVIKDFVKKYQEFKSPGTAGNVPTITKMLLDAHSEFERFAVPAAKPRKTRTTRVLALAA